MAQTTAGVPESRQLPRDVLVTSRVRIRAYLYPDALHLVVAVNGLGGSSALVIRNGRSSRRKTCLFVGSPIVEPIAQRSRSFVPASLFVPDSGHASTTSRTPPWCPQRWWVSGGDRRSRWSLPRAHLAPVAPTVSLASA